MKRTALHAAQQSHGPVGRHVAHPRASPVAVRSPPPCTATVRAVPAGRLHAAHPRAAPDVPHNLHAIAGWQPRTAPWLGSCRRVWTAWMRAIMRRRAPQPPLGRSPGRPAIVTTQTGSSEVDGLKRCSAARPTRNRRLRNLRRPARARGGGGRPVLVGRLRHRRSRGPFSRFFHFPGLGTRGLGTGHPRASASARRTSPPLPGPRHGKRSRRLSGRHGGA